MSAVNFEIKSPKFLPSVNLTSSEQTIRKPVNYIFGKFIVTERVEVTRSWVEGSGELLLHGYRLPTASDERVLEIWR